MCEYLCCGWAQWNDQKEIVTQLIITIEKCIYFRLVCTELIFFLTANIQIMAGQLAGRRACTDYMQNRQLIKSLQIHYLIIQYLPSQLEL